MHLTIVVLSQFMAVNIQGRVANSDLRFHKHRFRIK
jgi:hypothetical protein